VHGYVSINFSQNLRRPNAPAANTNFRGTAPLEALAPAIGHHYLLEFDEHAKTTRITSGYFQKDKKHAA